MRKKAILRATVSVCVIFIALSPAFAGKPKPAVDRSLPGGGLIHGPDLVVSSFEVETVMPGEKALDGTISNHKRYYFVWTVANKGDRVSRPSTLKIECQSWGQVGCPPGTNKLYDIPTLWPRPNTPSGAIKIWNNPPFEPTSRAQFRFRATVDPEHKVAEQSEANNVLESHFDSSYPYETLFKPGAIKHVGPLSEKPHISSRTAKHSVPLTAVPQAGTTPGHLKPSQALHPGKGGINNRAYGAGGDPHRGRTQTAMVHAGGPQGALKITPPVITSLKRGQTFAAPATLKLRCTHAPGQNVTYELEKKDKSGRFRLLTRSLSGNFGNLGSGVYRVRALYTGKGLPAGKWHEFTVRGKPTLRKFQTSTPGKKPSKMHVPVVK